MIIGDNEHRENLLNSIDNGFVRLTLVELRDLLKDNKIPFLTKDLKTWTSAKQYIMSLEKDDFIKFWIIVKNVDYRTPEEVNCSKCNGKIGLGDYIAIIKTDSKTVCYQCALDIALYTLKNEENNDGIPIWDTDFFTLFPNKDAYQDWRTGYRPVMSLLKELFTSAPFEGFYEKLIFEKVKDKNNRPKDTLLFVEWRCRLELKIRDEKLTFSYNDWVTHLNLEDLKQLHQTVQFIIKKGGSFDTIAELISLLRSIDEKKDNSKKNE